MMWNCRACYRESARNGIRFSETRHSRVWYDARECAEGTKAIGSRHHTVLVNIGQRPSPAATASDPPGGRVLMITHSPGGSASQGRGRSEAQSREIEPAGEGMELHGEKTGPLMDADKR
jgi:hypothetical protein